MNYITFKEHMHHKLNSLDSFYEKVTEFQQEKNRDVQKKQDGMKQKYKELSIVCMKTY